MVTHRLLAGAEFIADGEEVRIILPAGIGIVLLEDGAARQELRMPIDLFVEQVEAADDGIVAPLRALREAHAIGGAISGLRHGEANDTDLQRT